MRLLSAVVPVFDERENLVPLVHELRRALESLGPAFEILLVDDGSRDGSREVLAELARAVPELRVLHLDRNCGQSAALVAGFAAAQGDAIVTLDGDLQNDPADIPRLLERFGDCDMVAGVRRERHDRWLRRASSRIANRVRSAVLGDGIADTGCSLKLLRREVVAGFPRFDGMHRFLPAFVQMQGGRVVQLPVNHRARRGGASKYGVGNRLWRVLLDLAGVWWLRRRALHWRVEPPAAAQERAKPLARVGEPDR